ncbi:MAG: hypothetical protein GY811_23515 [Myxococcales bacterium]|nr:hypothetical protein [Myxococcales bacterium]
MTVLAYEAANFHARKFAQHEADYRRETATLISDGLAIEESAYLRAQGDRARLRAQVLERLNGFDAFVMPSAPGPAPCCLISTADSSFCAPASFAGLPSISLPNAVNDTGLPLAIQLVGHPGRDLDLLALILEPDRCQFGNQAPSCPGMDRHEQKAKHDPPKVHLPEQL